ncbi:hypothetical protein M430DRAFT_111635 [Amorphotheca resinae ATCC 22711]|uniref:Uncharacterized protein n=1 Tax=Amorphotheca resinae ATCC 22711 TaxID=857342 RepID=A0A2T3BCN2_AMORE|nr:hypothetical protein M430DRAFT_111635 [Amorphotheca resinae ATCC 22711]PSS27161.1 hypothetical protein M430DRAFT_111635 [Amorphotheca resinae ATCC 22711]
MPDGKKSNEEEAVQDAKKTVISYAQGWGRSPLPPTALATLITALHARPWRTLPMLFPPVLLFSSYLNLSSYEVDSAGLTAAWSGLYMLLAGRRKAAGGRLGTRLGSKFGARGLTRGSAMILSAVNVLGCGTTYALGRLNGEERAL